MNRKTDNRIVLVTQKTRLENLICRYNTEGQVKFYLESHGGDFYDYKREHETYHAAVDTAVSFLVTYGRTQVIDRDNVPNYIFGKQDLVIAVGRDGLVANVMKYLTTQKLIGINPEPERWDGVLLPFRANDLAKIVPEAFSGNRLVKSVTFAEAQLNDGQSICGVNDIFIGQRTHASARYEISIGGKKECQSSSGIVVSTGLGSTGWLKSILAGAAAIVGQHRPLPEMSENFAWDAQYLRFTVREPYPSTSTSANIVFGTIEKGSSLLIASAMAENGVIFSDGVEQDYIAFNAGAIARIGLSERHGNLIV